MANHQRRITEAHKYVEAVRKSPTPDITDDMWNRMVDALDDLMMILTCDDNTFDELTTPERFEPSAA